MAIGDDATAAGMALVAGSVQAKTIDTEINRTRDYLAQRTTAVTPINKGGTNATTAAAARTNLDVPSNSDLTTGLGNKVNLSALAAPNTATANAIPVYNSSGQLTSVAPTLSGHVVDLGTLLGGFSCNGQIYLPNSTTATSGWTAAYINGDGRICRGASSLRYKKYVSEVDPASLGNIAKPLKRFQMKGGDGRWTYGHIAEELAEDPATEQFVMYDGDGRPDSIDYMPYVLARLAQLEARVKELEDASSQ